MSKTRSQKTSKSTLKKKLMWASAVLLIILGVATAYAVLPAISLNSPTSLPVDI